MVDVFEVAKIIIDRIKAHYPQDIAIVGYYGSYLQGRATERSDLDFFFIPATPRGREVELQFIIEGISFDFWPIPWDRAERMAALEDWKTTIIADCELLYVRSPDDLARFMELRETAAALHSPSHTLRLIQQAETTLGNCFINLAKLRLPASPKDLSYCRVQAQEIVTSLLEAFCFLNQVYYTRGWGHYREQIRKLPIKPTQLEKHLDTIMFSPSRDDILHACEQLTVDTLRLIAERRKNVEETRSYQDRLKGYYEEERGMMNKLLTACEKGDYETAFFVAIGVHDGLARMLYFAEKGSWPSSLDSGEYRAYYERFGYPNLISLLSPTDFEPLRLAVLALIDKLEGHLQAEGLVLHQFDSVAQFGSFVLSRH
ncbi:nucleotidyltransferase domain-containing protein [Paenibacillus radicis (ex Gao et al. 2016)]|uniref:Nucleotidyltransferase domain-containing protein n=1 Tax=Paenibacillus radicis (ex Gao et al. 2016) TaxID=1737354 RepID=A0A917HA43_9BACL|nr:nucleotidyltransferase domain-containing protein [Paenibacillus radicis (ex Gao et al. 2016)]GGG72570.1 hypothetical protein GCM10010918_30520 [Paenibacillus radicis (ex Gao et al. 2016)]